MVRTRECRAVNLDVSIVAKAQLTHRELTACFNAYQWRDAAYNPRRAFKTRLTRAVKVNDHYLTYDELTQTTNGSWRYCLCNNGHISVGELAVPIEPTQALVALYCDKPKLVLLCVKLRIIRVHELTWHDLLCEGMGTYEQTTDQLWSQFYSQQTRLGMPPTRRLIWCYHMHFARLSSAVLPTDKRLLDRLVCI